MEGYNEYLDIRREKLKTMRISGAYAWVKGNHIDDKVAEVCSDYGVESKIAKAGLTWQYLQFNYGEEKILFIVKNARYFNKDQVDKGKDAKGRTRNKKISYMTKLMEINSKVDFSKVRTEKVSEEIVNYQLELFESLPLSENDHREIEKIQSHSGSLFDSFYIVTYALDENHVISNISLFMPSPKDNKAYLVEDLTKFIEASYQEVIENDLLEALSNSSYEDNIDAFEFDIEILDEADEEDEQSGS